MNTQYPVLNIDELNGKTIKSAIVCDVDGIVCDEAIGDGDRHEFNLIITNSEVCRLCVTCWYEIGIYKIQEAKNV